MKRLTLEIYLPASQQAFDVQVPAGALLSQVASLAGQEISRLSGGTYEADDGSILCKSTGNHNSLTFAIGHFIHCLFCITGHTD